MSEQDETWEPQRYLSLVRTPEDVMAFFEAWGIDPQHDDLRDWPLTLAVIQRADVLHDILDEHQRGRVVGYLDAARERADAITEADIPFITGVLAQTFAALTALKPPAAVVCDFVVRALRAHEARDRRRLACSPFYEVDGGRRVWAFCRPLLPLEARAWGVDDASVYALAVAADEQGGVRAIVPRVAGDLPTQPFAIAERIQLHGRHVACSFSGRPLNFGGAA